MSGIWTTENEEKNRTECVRCGACCLSSSPTLQAEDVTLVKKGYIRRDYLYTIRRGELVRDNIKEKLTYAANELIKVRENEEKKGCIYFDETEKACTIYDNRPSQCKAQACWDTSEFMNVYKSPKAKRDKIVQDGVLLGLVSEHERKCSYRKLDGLVKQIESKGEKAVSEILELLKFDFQLRPFISKKLGVPINEMDFLFGRPLIETIRIFGLQIKREADGSFFLTIKSDR